MKSSSRSSECKCEFTTTITNLPEDVLIDILSRLSVKTIFISRCVSKTWYNLLSSSNTQFTKLHFTRSPVQFILRPLTGACFSMVEFDDDTDVDNNSIKPIPFQFRASSNLVVINSCNGFLCLAPKYNCSPVKVCNPITGEYLNIPKSKMYDYSDTYAVSGFGFCAKTNQYKVVRLVHRGGLFQDRVVEVYTIGYTESWRTIGTAPKYQVASYCNTFYNGKIHWVSNDWECFDFIISFDLETEKFGNVPPPPHFTPEARRRSNYCIDIGVLGEFLYISHDKELWVMKEYGSWTKVRVDSSNYSLQAIKYLSGGKILMYYDNVNLVSYDPVKEISKNIGDFRFCKPFKPVAHVPSFMSFNDAMMGDKGAKLHTEMCRAERKGRN